LKYLVSIWIVFLLSVNANAQELANRKIKTIEGDYVSFSIDNLDNIYLLSAANQLKKYNASGDSVSVFNETRKFGKATVVDVTNPVKILLYYQGFSIFAFLDGVLNLKSSVDLRRKGIFNAEAIGLSYDGKIWVFDEMENTLKKLDDQGNTIFKTTDFRQLFDISLNPVRLFDQNQYLYLYDSLQGIFVFDYYGTFKKKIPITHWQHLRIVDQYIYGVSNSTLNRYNLNTLEQKEWLIPDEFKSYRQLFYNGKTLFALGKKGLEIYK